MDWFERDFDHPAYFEIYQDKAEDAGTEGPGLAALLDLPQDSLVFDLPCGWGRLRPALLQAGYRVTGGDLSPLNLHRHQQECPGQLVRLDLRNLPFRTRSADGILCAFTSWGYFATDQENLRQLQEFARVLKSGGVLILDLVGRDQCLKGIRMAGNRWYQVGGLYRERVRLSADGRRVYTERICRGARFRHDIWIPEDQEVRLALDAAGLRLDEAYGDVAGAPWNQHADRWIYRAIKA